MGNSLDTECFEESDEFFEAFEREGIVKDIADGVWTAIEVATVASLAAFKILSPKEIPDSDHQELRNQELSLKKSEDFTNADQNP